MKKTLALAILLCAIALPLRFHAHHMLNGFDWHPVSHPIRLVANHSFETSFIADQSSGFELVLSTARSPQEEKQRCRLGLAPLDRPKMCHDSLKELALAWTIYSGKQILTTGQYLATVDRPLYSSYDNRRVGAVLETFSTVESNQYNISLQINNGDEFLNALDPRLDVKIMPMPYTEVYKMSKSFEYFANLLLGLVVLIVMRVLIKALLSQNLKAQTRRM